MAAALNPMLHDASSSSSYRCRYHTFLSFRGKDTRKGFTDHLYRALELAGIHTFRDDDEIERGADIAAELNKAINESKVSIIVFSQNYASSSWCLDELVKIMERRKHDDGHIVMPVFYNVDPSHVRNQRGSFAEAFSRHEERFKEEMNKVEEWRRALKDATDLAGMALKDRYESQFIQDIVKEIGNKLDPKVFNVAPYAVGIDDRAQGINMWLEDGSNAIGVAVIYGMGGIGKTTIAKAAYNRNFGRFQGSSFLADIKEAAEQPYGFVRLQRKLLSDIQKGKAKKIDNIDEGIIKIKHAEEIPAEVIAKSIELVKKQQEAQKGEPTSSKLALFDDMDAENSTAVPKPEDRASRELAMVTSPLKPMSVVMPLHSVPGSSTTASFADPELVEFEAMDLEAQLQKLEKLGATPSKAKSKAVNEAVDRIRIWQSTELDLDENKEAIDQLMKDLDLLHRENVAPRPILEISLGLARDVLNLHNRYEDLKPSFNASEFCKAMHEANLVDYHKQKSELDALVADYKETKSAADKLEKHIEDLQKQLARLRDRQKDIGAILRAETKATFLVQNIVSALKPTLEIAEASIHQGVLLQKEMSIKKTGLQETLQKLGL